MKKEFAVNPLAKYLRIPVATKGTLCTISISNAVAKMFEFQIPVTACAGESYAYDFFAYLPISPDFWGKLSLEGDMPEVFTAMVTLETEIPCQGSRERPCIHYTPESGWINDPNGLVYHNGIYHLYYQYNPFHIEWGNMSWGHAVSKDLLHWQQCDAVLFPDEDGVIYSGSAIENTHGLLELPEEAMIYYYTCAGNASDWSRGKPYVQRAAYSMDHGYTLHKIQGEMVAEICTENRDPKIIWHEASQAYVMCLWLENNEFAILRSYDLKNWEVSQRLELDQGFECPNLFELQTAEGASVWIIWTADGYYYQGRFDGRRFETDGIKREAWYGRTLYAAQMFSGVEDRVVMIPWFRTNVREDRYRGAMGLPQELYPEFLAGEVHLRMRPVREYYDQRILRHVALPMELYTNAMNNGSIYAYQTEYQIEEPCAIEVMTVCSDTSDMILWNLFGTRIKYDRLRGDLCIENVVQNHISENRMEERCVGTEKVAVGQKIYSFSLILDAGLLEIYCSYDKMNSDILSMQGLPVFYDKMYAAELDMTEKTGNIRVCSGGLRRVELYSVEEQSVRYEEA